MGVFHAQGKGGLPIDINTARTCFIKAARLGQVQAQHALDLEQVKIQSKKNVSPVPNKSPKNSSLEKSENDTRVKLSDFMLHTSDDTFSTKSSQIFLDFLGLKRPSRASIIIPTNDCRVPC